MTCSLVLEKLVETKIINLKYLLLIFLINNQFFEVIFLCPYLGEVFCQLI